MCPLYMPFCGVHCNSYTNVYSMTMNDAFFEYLYKYYTVELLNVVISVITDESWPHKWFYIVWIFT